MLCLDSNRPTSRPAVFLGEFQLPRRDDVARLEAALQRSRRCVVALEWAGAAASPAHPFSWQERAAVLRQAVADGLRLEFVPVRQHYDDRRALRQVEQALRLEQGWQVEGASTTDRLAHERLHALYGAKQPQGAVERMATDLAPPAVAAVRAWIGTPAFDRLRGEHSKMAEEQAVWARVPWPVTLVTVDAVVRAAGHATRTSSIWVTPRRRRCKAETTPLTRDGCRSRTWQRWNRSSMTTTSTSWTNSCS